jgi:hypothetical protein
MTSLPGEIEGLKNFLSPNRSKLRNASKILTLGMILLITYFLVWVILGAPAFIFMPVALGLSNIILISPILGFSMVALLAYPAGCLLYQRKSLAIPLMFFFASVILSSVLTEITVNAYNSAFARSCNQPSDCHFVCGGGSFNNRHIPFSNNLAIYADCFGMASARCISSACETVMIDKVSSIAECGSLGNTEDQHRCLEYLVTRKKSNMDCEDIYWDENQKEWCYWQTLKLLNDSLLCERIKLNAAYADDCYLSTAINSKNDTVCERMRDDIKKQSCASELAVLTKNPKLCETFPEKTFASMVCYQKVAVAKGDPNICELIRLRNITYVNYGKYGTYGYNTCFMDVARATKNLPICDNIDDYHRDECHRITLPKCVGEGCT